MSQLPVKWATRNNLHSERNPGLEPYEIPVVPLSALREVNDFLQEIVESAVVCTDYKNGDYRCIHCGKTNEPSGEFTHLNDCEIHTAQRLLASLGEQT